MKKRAIQEKLIWNDRHIFEKTEIRDSEDKIKLKKIEKKFEIEEQQQEDYAIPPKIEIFYSKFDIYFEIGVSISIIGVGIYLLVNGETFNYVLGTIMEAIGFYGIVKKSRTVLNNEIQISIDNKGIKTKNVDFKNWSTIKNVEETEVGSGKSAKSYLTYFYDNNEYEKIEIDSLNVTPEELGAYYILRNCKNLGFYNHTLNYTKLR